MTIATRIAALQERQNDLEQEITLLRSLPEAFPSDPTISNIRHAPEAGQPLAWLSFSAPSYDPDGKWNPVAVLAGLEAAGFEQSLLTLCKWDNYRGSPYPAALEQVPETRKGSFGRFDTLTDASPIAPLWIAPSQHTNTDAKLYMTHGGELYHVNIDVPRAPVGISATRNEYRGGWSYERGSAKLRFPEQWHSMEHWTIHQESRAWVDTEQGISGAIYFAPHGEQTAWPMKASEFLALLLATK